MTYQKDTDNTRVTTNPKTFMNIVILWYDVKNKVIEVLCLGIRICNRIYDLGMQLILFFS